MSEKKMKVMITIVIVIIFSMIITFTILNYIERGNRSNTSIGSSDRTEDKIKKYDERKGIIVNINEKYDQFIIREVNDENELVFSATENMDVYNKYNHIIDVKKLCIGDYVVVGYDKEYENTKYIKIYENILQYKDLENYILDDEHKYIEIDDTKYRLGDDTFVYSQGEEASIYDIESIDVLKINIIDKDIVSAVIEKGHGYISFINDKDYIGETLVLGDTSLEIEKGMRVPILEGTNEIVIKTNKLKGEKTINVKRGKTVVIDINKLKFVKKKEGEVTFEIEPKGARLYINGKAYSGNDKITLDYGKYLFNVESLGYESIAGQFILDELTKKIKVELQEKVETEEPEKSISPEATKKSDSEEDEEKTETSKSDS